MSAPTSRHEDAETAVLAQVYGYLRAIGRQARAEAAELVDRHSSDPPSEHEEAAEPESSAAEIGGR